ncbi:hypothetical protein E4U55_005491 [Claviceps digitariae]|nr:hypothetical protein E4U55_005491 [Claviceps digitariae]
MAGANTSVSGFRHLAPSAQSVRVCDVMCAIPKSYLILSHNPQNHGIRAMAVVSIPSKVVSRPQPISERLVHCKANNGSASWENNDLVSWARRGLQYRSAISLVNMPTGCAGTDEQFKAASGLLRRPWAQASGLGTEPSTR